MLNKYIKVKYDADKTILECNKCGHQETEWYNNQPSDPCTEIDCSGRMVRVLKKNEFKRNLNFFNPIIKKDFWGDNSCY